MEEDDNDEQVGAFEIIESVMEEGYQDHFLCQERIMNNDTAYFCKTSNIGIKSESLFSPNST